MPHPPNITAADNGTASFVPPETVLTADVLIGMSLAIGGNMLISMSLNLQKYTHSRIQATQRGQQYFRSPLWWFALMLMGLGEAGNFAAYGFAPASLVAPLGSTTVVANMFIAVIFLKEKLRPDDIFGCTYAAVGAFLLVSFSAADEVVLDGWELELLCAEPTFIAYFVIELVLLVVLLILRYKCKMENVVVLILICALLASFTVISAKGLSNMIQLVFQGVSQAQYWIFWVMLIVMISTACLQVKFLNSAMQSFTSTIVVPTNFVFFTISAIIAGIVFYKELYGMSALDIWMFLFGAIMCFIGVYFITAGRADSSPPPGPAAQESLAFKQEKDRYDRHRLFLPDWLVIGILPKEDKKEGTSVLPVASGNTTTSFTTADETTESSAIMNSVKPR